jgi:hypothetical protein
MSGASVGGGYSGVKVFQATQSRSANGSAIE